MYTNIHDIPTSIIYMMGKYTKRSNDALPTISLLKYQKVQFQLNFTAIRTGII